MVLFLNFHVFSSLMHYRLGPDNFDLDYIQYQQRIESGPHGQELLIYVCITDLHLTSLLVKTNIN